MVTAVASGVAATHRSTRPSTSVGRSGRVRWFGAASSRRRSRSSTRSNAATGLPGASAALASSRARVAANPSTPAWPTRSAAARISMSTAPGVTRAVISRSKAPSRGVRGTVVAVAPPNAAVSGTASSSTSNTTWVRPRSARDSSRTIRCVGTEPCAKASRAASRVRDTWSANGSAGSTSARIGSTLTRGPTRAARVSSPRSATGAPTTTSRCPQIRDNQTRTPASSVTNGVAFACLPTSARAWAARGGRLTRAMVRSGPRVAGRPRSVGRSSRSGAPRRVSDQNASPSASGGASRSAAAHARKLGAGASDTARCSTSAV